MESPEPEDRPADIYSSLPLDHDNEQIRVLDILPGRDVTIRCRIHRLSLSDAKQDPYETLSYTWGASTQHRTISILHPNDGSDCIISVTDNLYNALQGLRPQSPSDHPRRHWADAICINQADDIEKSRQVALMERIYRRCTLVNVWLGEPLSSMKREKNTWPCAHLSHLERFSSRPMPALVTRQTDSQLHRTCSVGSFLLGINNYWKRSTIRVRHGLLAHG
jgi:hypothetical protein